MTTTERSLLLESYKIKHTTSTRGLSVAVATVCIIDVFGVFPLVTFPKAVIQCGYYGIFVVVFTISVQMYTAVLLGKCWLIAEELKPNIKTKSRCPYSALAELTWGKWMTYLTNFLLDISVFAAGIPNLIVASQNLQLLGQRLTSDSFNFSYCFWIITIGAVLCPVLWLGSPKDMKFVCILSTSLVVGVFVLIIGCILFDSASTKIASQTTKTHTPLWNYLLTTYGILIFQFDIHPTILTIQVDMLQKNKLNLAIFCGFFLTFSMFGIVTLCVYLTYGDKTSWSLLETLPTSKFLHVAAFLIIIQLSLTLAIGNSTLYQHIEDCMGIPRIFNKRRCIIRSILMILAITLAESVPRFDLVMSMIGTTFTGPIVFILPPLFYLKILRMKTEYEKQLRNEVVINLDVALSIKESQEEDNVQAEVMNKLIHVALSFTIAIFGVISIIVTTYFNVFSALQYGTFLRPCIYNFTMYLIS